MYVSRDLLLSSLFFFFILYNFLLHQSVPLYIHIYMYISYIYIYIYILIVFTFIVCQLVTYSGQLFIQVDDLQLLVLVHTSHVDVHVRGEFRLLGAIRALVTGLFTALEMAMGFHVGEPGVTTVTPRAIKLFPRHGILNGDTVGPVGPRRNGGWQRGRGRGGRLLTATGRLHVEERLVRLRRLLRTLGEISSRLLITPCVATLHRSPSSYHFRANVRRM